MLGVIRLSRMWPHLGAPYSTIPTSALTIAACGPVLYVYYFLTNVLLDNFLLLDDFLTQADLLLDHRAFLDHDLFLDNWYPDLVALIYDPGLHRFRPPTLLDRHPPHANLLALLGHREPFAAGPYPLADVDSSGLALTSASYELFLVPLHPDFVLVSSAVTTELSGALMPWGDRAFAPLYIARRDVYARTGLQIDPVTASSVRVVRAVGLPLDRSLPGLHPVVVEDLPLELRGYLPVVAEGRAVLYRLFVRCYLDEPSFVVHADDVYRDQGRARAQEAHLHADVLWVVVLVHEEVVDLADLLVVHVVNGVLRVQIFNWSRAVPAFLISQNRTSYE